MNLTDLRYLSVSAVSGNFGRAAESLGLNASTISRRIARLEDELGVTLFERGHFGIRLTSRGKAVMVHVHRVLADLDTLARSGDCNGSGKIGEIRLGVRMPPIGEPLLSLLSRWHEKYPNVAITLHEMNERDIRAALEERRLDVALMPRHTLWPRAPSVPLYRERIVVALPKGHVLEECDAVSWDLLQDELLLVQGWDECQTAREFYGSFLGGGVRFGAHAASKQSIFALVAAGFGITLATESQSQVTFPAVVYRPIREQNAWVQVDLVWIADVEDATIGRFVAFMRDEVCLRGAF